MGSIFRGEVIYRYATGHKIEMIIKTMFWKQSREIFFLRLNCSQKLWNLNILRKFGRWSSIIGSTVFCSMNYDPITSGIDPRILLLCHGNNIKIVIKAALNGANNLLVSRIQERQTNSMVNSKLTLHFTYIIKICEIWYIASSLIN